MENRCVFCGTEIPEGKQICPICESERAKSLKYTEILKLRKYCEKIGVEARLERAFEGHVIRFNNGANFAQHYGTAGSDRGCVEPGGISRNLDYTAVPLETAKSLVRYHKNKLNG